MLMIHVHIVACCSCKNTQEQQRCLYFTSLGSNISKTLQIEPNFLLVSLFCLPVLLDVIYSIPQIA